MAVADTFWGKVLLGAIAAGIGFALSILVDRIKVRREPRKEISWDAHEEGGIVAVSPAIRERVEIQ
jgi:Na+/H+ antiporter NhaA